MKAKRRIRAGFWTTFAIAGFLGVTLLASAQQATNVEERPVTSNNGAQTSITTYDAAVGLPDSPSAVIQRSSAQGQPADPNGNPPAQPTPDQTAQTQSNTPQQSSPVPPLQSSPPPQRPVGTAAAELPNSSGIAASQPAGVAIAPAKQRRVRTIVLRTGALLGAAVAVGAVVALTAATPSKPSGAH